MNQPPPLNLHAVHDALRAAGFDRVAGSGPLAGYVKALHPARVDTRYDRATLRAEFHVILPLPEHAHRFPPDDVQRQAREAVQTLVDATGDPHLHLGAVTAREYAFAESSGAHLASLLAEVADAAKAVNAGNTSTRMGMRLNAAIAAAEAALAAAPEPAA